MPVWTESRQDASFRSVPFVITDNTLRRGRQVALHVYPFRDDPWPEDLGRSPRVTSFRGFVVGDDADERIERLVEAAEQPGPGELIHPSLGALTVMVLTFACSDEAGRGRVWSFEMSVVPALDRIYPVAAADTPGLLHRLFDSTGDAIAADFASVKAKFNEVKGQVEGVVSTAQGYAREAQGLIRDAQSVARLPGRLIGNFGRFTGLRVNPNLLGTERFAGRLGTANRTLANFSSSGGSISAVNGAASSVGRIGARLDTLAAKL